MPAGHPNGISFGLKTWRRLNTFREGKNPFTGEIVRFYDYRTTVDERRSLAECLTKHGIRYDCVGYFGELDGSLLILDTPEVRYGFTGCGVEILPPLSDAALNTVLDIATAGSLVFSGEIDLPWASPDEELARLYRDRHEGPIEVAATPSDFRNWLYRCAT